MEKIVQLRKKAGLRTIKTKNGNINPTVFHQENKDETMDGTPSGIYQSSGLPNTKQFLSPQWNPLKNEYSWGGTEEDFIRLVNKLRLRYVKGHNKEGQDIVVTSLRDCISDYRNEVFTHPRFYGAKYMEQGKVSLQSSDPVDEFIYYCYISNPQTDDKTKKVSKYVQAGTKFEVISPKEEKKERANDAESHLEAMEYLIGMKNDEERMRSVCTVLQLPGFDEKTTEASTMRVMLMEAAESKQVYARYNNKQMKSRFMEVAKMNNEDLLMTTSIIKGKKYSFLQKRKDHYLFQGKTLKGLINNTDLFNYFKNPNNYEDYEDLIKAIETVV